MLSCKSEFHTTNSFLFVFLKKKNTNSGKNIDLGNGDDEKKRFPFQVIICLSQEHRRSKRDRKVGDHEYSKMSFLNEHIYD